MDIKEQLQPYLDAALQLPMNPLVHSALRRQQRQACLLPGWKRNSWVFLIYPLALALAVLLSVSIRNANSWHKMAESLSNVGFGVLVGVVAPLAIVWLLAGLFRMCRDCLGWYSRIKDSGGAQMLDGLICMSPIGNHEVLLAGIRLYIAPIWPRIISLAVVFNLVCVLAMEMSSRDRSLQALWFMPLSILAMSISGILGSILLGLYLFLIGLNMSLNMIVPLLSFLIILLQIFCLSFGGAFFGEISGTEQLTPEMVPLALLGLAAGAALFYVAVRLAFGTWRRATWLLVTLPLMVPVVIAFMFMIANLWSMGLDEEPFIAFYGNLMWVYNCFMPFSPFSAPTVMLRGASLSEAWQALAFEPWRWSLLIMLQLLFAWLLARTALIATNDRRTALD